MKCANCGEDFSEGFHSWETGGPCTGMLPEAVVRDPVNHPPHYGGDLPTEPIKVIEAWGLGFCLSNAVKYISRARKKGAPLEDLKKAAWYLNREIERMERP